MKTALDQSTVIYNLLKADPELSYALSGGIYKTLRPASSKLEDVVVNTVTLSDGSLQRGVSNVNLHIADTEIDVYGKKSFMPNEIRFAALTGIVKPIIEDIFGTDYSFYVSNTMLIREPEINQHYLNFRIEFIFENPN